MAEFLSDYIDNVEPSMDFEFKATYVSSFDDLSPLIITIGGALNISFAAFGTSVLTMSYTKILN